MSSYFRAARDPSFLGLRPGLEVAGGFGFCWNVRLFSARKKYPFSSNYFYQSFVRAELSLDLFNRPTLDAWVAHFSLPSAWPALGPAWPRNRPAVHPEGDRRNCRLHKPAGFVWFQLIDIAVFENAGGERQSDVDNLHAFSRNHECTMARTATANCTACAALLGPPPKPVAALFTVHKSRDSWSVPAIGIVAQERPVVHARNLTMPRLQPPAGRRAWNENLN